MKFTELSAKAQERAVEGAFDANPSHWIDDLTEAEVRADLERNTQLNFTRSGEYVGEDTFFYSELSAPAQINCRKYCKGENAKHQPAPNDWSIYWNLLNNGRFDVYGLPLQK